MPSDLSRHNVSCDADNIDETERASGRVRAPHDLSRVTTSFDKQNLVPNAGLLRRMLAQRIDLARLVDDRLHLASHGASKGAKR